VSGATESLRVDRVAAPLRERVHEILRDAILDGHYKPGQRLIERELIDDTGVSRTTIREVLRELAAEGLVVTIPQRGVVVVSITEKEAQDIFEVHQALESLAARRFVVNASDDDLKALRAAFERFRSLATDADTSDRDVLQAKDDFFGVFFDAAGNDAIRPLLRTLKSRVRILRVASLSDAKRRGKIVRELRAILVAGEKRDADAMAQACETHITNEFAEGVHALER
jgi:DNA-binding GntR family transcriptional regulator